MPDDVRRNDPRPPDPESEREVVDSLQHPLAASIRRLLTREGRIELNQILIDDEENVLQALGAGLRLRSIYYAGEERVSQDLIRRLPPGVGIYEVARRTCKKLFENEKISRVFAVADTPAALDLESLAAVPQDVVVLEDLSIAGNIGAILRTSLALGVGGIVLLNADPVEIHDRRLIRASRGHVFALPVVTAGTDELISFCRQRSLELVVTAARANEPVEAISSLPQRLFIVFGAEKGGVSPALAGAATLEVRISTDPRVESLNVSAAAGIVLYARAGFNRARPR